MYQLFLALFISFLINLFQNKIINEPEKMKTQTHTKNKEKNN